MATSLLPEDRMFDLIIKSLENGGFELWQQSGIDESDVIELHPAQVRLLAERAGLLAAPDPKLLDRLSAAHIRRLLALRDRLSELFDFYHDEILDRCSSGIEISLHLRAISDLVDELVEQIDAAERGRGEEKPAPSNEKSPDISVTPTPSTRGRPATGNALTNADRQARHDRARNAPARSIEPVEN